MGVACSRLLDTCTFGQNEFFGTGVFSLVFERIFSSSYSVNCMPLVVGMGFFCCLKRAIHFFFEVAAIQYSLEYIAARLWFRVTLFGTESFHITEIFHKNERCEKPAIIPVCPQYALFLVPNGHNEFCLVEKFD